MLLDPNECKHPEWREGWAKKCDDGDLPYVVLYCVDCWEERPRKQKTMKKEVQNYCLASMFIETRLVWWKFRCAVVNLRLALAERKVSNLNDRLFTLHLSKPKDQNDG